MPIIVDIVPLLKNVGKILKIDETEEVSYPDDGLVLVAPVRIVGELVNTGRSILLTGKVRTKILLQCSRCASDFEYPVKFDIEENYVRPQNEIVEFEEESGGGEHELTDDDMVFEVEPNNKINISEAIRQNLLTAIPIKPLCDEKCKGGK